MALHADGEADRSRCPELSIRVVPVAPVVHEMPVVKEEIEGGDLTIWAHGGETGVGGVTQFDTSHIKACVLLHILSHNTSTLTLSSAVSAFEVPLPKEATLDESSSVLLQNLGVRPPGGPPAI